MNDPEGHYHPQELCAYPGSFYTPEPGIASSSSQQNYYANIIEYLLRICRTCKRRTRRYWLDVRQSERRQRKLLKRMEVVYVLVFLLLLGLFVYYMIWGDNATDKTLIFRFVSIRESRFDIHMRSEELSCEKISGSVPVWDADLLFVDIMKSAGERLLKQRSGMVCNCAPLYNVPVRYITLAQAHHHHLFNPIVVGSLPELGKSLVTESQELLIPGAGARNMTRLNGIQLRYHDEWCQVQQQTFTYNTAWCIQSCIDLLNGKTIYEN